MNWLTAIFMVLFPLLGVIYLIMDGIFYDKVKSNSNNVLTYEDAKDYKAIILTFFVVGIMVTLINIELFIATAIRQRNIACKDSEIHRSFTVVTLYDMAWRCASNCHLPYCGLQNRIVSERGSSACKSDLYHCKVSSLFVLFPTDKRRGKKLLVVLYRHHRKRIVTYLWCCFVGASR